tara:strand:- start:30 stop:383 length:354 start_codon:yes stop_codon:yes gene_type:complete
MNTGEFKNKIKTYIKLDEEIKILQKKLSKYREAKKKLTLYILNNMNKINRSNIKITDNLNLKIKETNQYNSISKSYLSNILHKHLKDTKIADQILDIIYNNRTKTVNNTLEIIKSKK